jgi:hypothetical protein
MMTRRKISALPLLAFGGLHTVERAVASDDIVVDDGAIDLRPQFLVNYVLGKPTMRVQCHFDSLALKKVVQLGPDGFVSINGTSLVAVKNTKSRKYEAQIPADKNTLEIKITRTRELSTTFDIVVPKFTITSHPKVYKNPDDLKITLAQQAADAPYRSVEDHFWMDIKHPRSTIVALREARGPTKSDHTLLLRSIGLPFVGPYQGAVAMLVRHNRVALKDVTADYKSGWIVLTVEQEFPIDVL